MHSTIYEVGYMVAYKEKCKLLSHSTIYKVRHSIVGYIAKCKLLLHSTLYKVGYIYQHTYSTLVKQYILCSKSPLL